MTEVTELHEELCDCEIGDIALNNTAPTNLRDLPGLLARPRYEPIAFFDEEGPAYENPPTFQFERALMTFNGSTAKVRVWRRVA